FLPNAQSPFPVGRERGRSAPVAIATGHLNDDNKDGVLGQVFDRDGRILRDDSIDVVTANSEDGYALPEIVRPQGRFQVKNSTFLYSSVTGINLGPTDPINCTPGQPPAPPPACFQPTPDALRLLPVANQ